MLRRKITGSRGGGRNGYEVGYCKGCPTGPVETGCASGPAGRRKGLPNLMTDVKRMLATTVKVKEGGRTRKKSTQETALRLLREKALGRDPRALDRLFELAVRFNNDMAEIGSAQPLPADDKAILAAYVAKFAVAATTPPDESSDDPALKRGARSDKKKAPK